MDGEQTSYYGNEEGALRKAGIQVPITAQFKFLTQCTEPVQMLKN
jgi:hypothetical protein